MVLLDNREVKKGWNEIKALVNGLLEKHGAKVLSSKLWGERRLAYPIGHQNRATYLLAYFSSDTSAVAMIRRELGLSEPVLRSLISVCDEVPASAHEPEVEFDVTQIREEAVELVSVGVTTPPAEEAAVEAAAEEPAPVASGADGAATEEKE